MKLGFFRNSICCVLLSVFSFFYLNADLKNTHLEVRYKLVDLGETDLPPHNLQRRFSQPLLAPSINNSGQIVGNRSEGGFLHDPQLGEWAPYIHGIVIYFHAISNYGDILVSLNRQTNDPEWMVWPTSTGKNATRQRIDVEAFPGRPIFWGLTNERFAIGNLLHHDDQSTPIYWRGEGQFQLVVDANGKPLKGRAQGINGNGQIVGIFENQKEMPPAVWSPSAGLTFMRNFRSKPVPYGTAELCDMVIAEDATVYGSYSLKFDDGTRSHNLYTYAWQPYEGGDFKLLDLEGMKISGINDWHSLVGSMDGVAVVCDPGKKPIPLNQFIRSEELVSWQLLEATSINNWGDIVGYGKRNGRTHLFLAQKLNNNAPYRPK